VTQVTPPEQPDRIGQVGGIVSIIQSMTLTHILILALLVALLAPTYVLWRAMNDQSMLNTFLSRYEEFADEHSPCILRVFSKRGSGDQWAISTGFAYQGNDKWVISVQVDNKPDPTELQSYCETLQRIVDFMRRPSAASPTFPGTDEPLIWQYPQE